jgi:Transposase DDE domain.
MKKNIKTGGSFDMKLTYKIEKSNWKITSFGGSVIMFDQMNKLKIEEKIDKELKKPGSNRGYSPSLYVKSLITLLHLGGENIRDMEKLSSDEALKEIGGFYKIPHISSIGDWLVRQGGVEGDYARSATIDGLCKIITYISGVGLNMEKRDSITLDIDATMIKGEKYESKKTYKGFKGMSSLMGFVGENGYCVGEEFRNGNISPATGNLEFIKECKSNINNYGIVIKRLRADSASYQAKIINYCEEKEIEYYIGADLDESVIKGINRIAENEWKTYIDRDGISHSKKEVASFVHCMNKSNNSFRIIVLREKIEEQNLFQEYNYKYKVIATNSSEEPQQVIHFYNERGNCERYIKEAKYGFGLRRLPSSSLAGNGVWSKIAMIAYNLFIYIKRIIFKGEYRNKISKSIRYLIYSVPAKISRHSGKSIILYCNNKLYNQFQEWLL